MAAWPIYSSRLKVAPSDPTCILLVFSFLFVLSRFAGRNFRNRRQDKGILLPPGPKPLPLIGNAADVPTSMMGQRFKEMTDKYGKHSHSPHCVSGLFVSNHFMSSTRRRRLSRCPRPTYDYPRLARSRVGAPGQTFCQLLRQTTVCDEGTVSCTHFA